MPSNPQRRTAAICWGLTLLFIFGIFAPGIFGMDGFDGGFAIASFCIIAAISSFIVAIMYQGRAGALDRILKGEKRLAQWKYDPAVWRDYAEKEYIREKKEKRGLFLMVAVISLVVGVIFTATHPDAGLVVLGILLALVLLIAFVAFFTTQYNYWMNKRYVGEAYITPDGVYLNRMLHLWKGWGASLDDVSYHEDGPYLSFEYSTPNRTGRADYTVRVPVPPGKEEEARQVLTYFQKENNI